MHASLLLSLAVSLAATHAAVIHPRLNATRTATARLITQAEPGSWYENIAIRQNGNLLATRLDTPSVYEIDPRTGESSVLATFPDVTAALGIAEYEPDVFAVAVGNFSRSTFTAVPGTYSIQSIDLRKRTDTHANATVDPQLLVAIPAASMLNGLVFRAPATLYASDTFGFQVWAIDTAARAASVAVAPNALFSNASAGGFPGGINGLKWDGRRAQLYFTNTHRILAGRVPWNAAAGRFEAPEQIAGGSAGTVDFDDLDFDERGNLYVANGLHGINFISPDGLTQYEVGQDDALVLNAPTAAKFGRGENSNVLYITTSGLSANLTAVGGQVASYTFTS